jgi:hypothetical protein
LLLEALVPVIVEGESGGELRPVPVSVPFVRIEEMLCWVEVDVGVGEMVPLREGMLAGTTGLGFSPDPPDAELSFLFLFLDQKDIAKTKNLPR